MHSYPAAATDPKLATGDWDDVSFLANEHRHKFGFKVWVEVFGNNREREFIQEKRFMERLYGNEVLDLNSKSCEMIAEDLYGQLAERYKNENREIWIEINEDNENGCFIQFDRT